MLYKFKSKAAGDLVLLEPQGKQFLQLIGKTVQAKGIIEPSDMPAAIAALQAARGRSRRRPGESPATRRCAAGV